MTSRDTTPPAGRVVGKVAIVTGAGTGIGRASSVLLAREGAAVVACGRRTEIGLDLVSQLRDEGLRAHWVTADVSLRVDAERLVREAVDQFGRLDIVVNNAAMHHYRTLEETTEEEWDRVLATNLKSVYLVSHEAIPHLRAAGGGSIINVASVHAVATMEKYAAYAASKGGVLALSRQVALDVARDGIRVNAMIVGGVNTPMAWDHFASRGLTVELSDPTEIGRTAEPEEIASGVLFLASSESSFVTGAPFYIDGGLLARI